MAVSTEQTIGGNQNETISIVGDHNIVQFATPRLQRSRPTFWIRPKRPSPGCP